MGVGRWVLRILGVLLALALCWGLWWLRPAPADESAMSVVQGAVPQLALTQSRTLLTMSPVEAAPAKGLIFYQGALVDPRAYAGILAPVAQAGYFVAIVKTPYDLPITDITAAQAVIDSHPEVTWWAVGGHSLGGVAAASFAGGTKRAQGLLLWASFPSSNLSDQFDLSVLSVSGTNDLLTTPADVEASKTDLPPSAQFVAVDGAVHSFFGDYGEQAGDGQPTVERAAAQEQIVAATLAWLAASSG